MVDNMDISVLLVTLLVISFHYSTSSDVTTPIASLQEHVKKLDEMLAEMQSHSKAQEQKNSAILSSTLSKLTQTTDELGDMKTSQNETIQNLEMKSVKLSELWASHNSTVSELHHLRVQHNNVVKELEETKDKLKDLQLQHLNGYIGFQVRLLKGRNTIANKTIAFDKILFDTSASYDRSTGQFIIPVYGTYLIWIDFTFQRPDNVVSFTIRTKDNVLERAYGSTFDPHETTSTIGIHYLKQGESISVESTDQVFLDNLLCNFGAVLLNAH